MLPLKSSTRLKIYIYIYKKWYFLEKESKEYINKIEVVDEMSISLSIKR